MKKVLFATTALVMTVGAAAAEVSVSGTGRMGFIYDSNAVEPENEFSFTSRARVIFTLTGESDAGLSFGGTFRADNADDANDGTAGSVYVSGTYGKLSMGDVDGAAEAAVGDLSGVGLTGLGDLNETWYLNAGFDQDSLFVTDPFDGAYALPAALYEYAFGATTVYVGFGNPSGETFITAAGTPFFLDKQYSVGLRYETDQYAAGIGYETADADGESIDQWILGGEAKFGGAVVKAIYGDISDLDIKQYGISGDYTFGATTVTAFARKVEVVDNDATVFGLGGSYDLGGGASFVAGVVDSNAANIDPIFDAGVSFTF